MALPHTHAGPLALPSPARLTPQRQAVLDAIADWEGSFTVPELAARARQRHAGLGLATAYRTVELLQREGHVRPVRGGEDGAYVRCSPEHHHHLVCVGCGAVQETKLCAAPAPAELKRRHGFVAESHDVEIYGTCADCS